MENFCTNWIEREVGLKKERLVACKKIPPLPPPSGLSRVVLLKLNMSGQGIPPDMGKGMPYDGKGSSQSGKRPWEEREEDKPGVSKGFWEVLTPFDGGAGKGGAGKAGDGKGGDGKAAGKPSPQVVVREQRTRHNGAKCDRELKKNLC